MNDMHWMKNAIRQAQQAGYRDEVPIGAIVVHNGQIIGRGGNSPIADHDPSAHAEIRALQEAAKYMKNYRLPETILYVTLEPCAMCAGAMVLARIQRVVYGASDPKAGAAGSVFNLLQSGKLNHQVDVQGGVLKAECAQLLHRFFKAKRELAYGR